MRARMVCYRCEPAPIRSAAAKSAVNRVFVGAVSDSLFAIPNDSFECAYESGQNRKQVVYIKLPLPPFGAIPCCINCLFQDHTFDRKLLRKSWGPA
jgi:hypothetical protein